MLVYLSISNINPFLVLFSTFLIFLFFSLLDKIMMVYQIIFSVYRQLNFKKSDKDDEKFFLSSYIIADILSFLYEKNRK